MQMDVIISSHSWNAIANQIRKNNLLMNETFYKRNKNKVLNFFIRNIVKNVKICRAYVSNTIRCWHEISRLTYNSSRVRATHLIWMAETGVCIYTTGNAVQNRVRTIVIIARIHSCTVITQKQLGYHKARIKRSCPCVRWWYSFHWTF